MKNLFKRSVIICIILMVYSCSTIEMNSKNLKSEKIAQLLKFSKEIGYFNGSVLVAENGNVIFHGAYGVEDFRLKKPLQIQSQFRLASVSKQFTAMAIMILKEKGLLNYDDKINKYLTELNYNEISVRNLLNHTAGLMPYKKILRKHYKRPKNGEKWKVVTNNDILSYFEKDQPKTQFNAGDKFAYSNTGYAFLKIIIERASGTSYEKFMSDNIFIPLGMKNTIVYNQVDDVEMPHRAYGFKETLDGKQTLNDFNFTNGVIGNDGVFSSTEDLFIYDQALYTEKLVSNETLNEAFKSTKLNSGKSKNYGFGWSLRNTKHSGKRVKHGGRDVGVSTLLQRDIEKHITLIILSNNSLNNLNELTSAIDSIMNNKPYKLPRMEVQRELFKVYNGSNISDVISHFHKYKKTPEEYVFSQNQLNRLGYVLLESGNISDAIELFKLNATEYPNSENVFDSLAEAYLKMNDKNNAIINYKKALTINSRFKSAREALSKLGIELEKASAVKVAIEILKTYIGNYQIRPGVVLNVSVKGLKLMGNLAGRVLFEFRAEADNAFYVNPEETGFDATFSFNKAKDKSVESLTMVQRGRKKIARKL